MRFSIDNLLICKHHFFLPSWVALLSVYFVLAVIASPALAEVRSYLQVSSTLLSKSDQNRGFKLDMFIKQENRFRESGLVLNKVFIGMKPKILPWLSGKIYYANKDLNYTRHLNKHIFAGSL